MNNMIANAQASIAAQLQETVIGDRLKRGAVALIVATGLGLGSAAHADSSFKDFLPALGGVAGAVVGAKAAKNNPAVGAAVGSIVGMTAGQVAKDGGVQNPVTTGAVAGGALGMAVSKNNPGMGAAIGAVAGAVIADKMTQGSRNDERMRQISQGSQPGGYVTQASGSQAVFGGPAIIPSGNTPLAADPAKAKFVTDAVNNVDRSFREYSAALKTDHDAQYIPGAEGVDARTASGQNVTRAQQFYAASVADYQRIRNQAARDGFDVRTADSIVAQALQAPEVRAMDYNYNTNAPRMRAGYDR